MSSPSPPPPPLRQTPAALFPNLTRAYILSFQFSSWYPLFSSHSIKSTIIRPLEKAFGEYLDADGVFVPVGAEDVPAESTLSDDEKDSDDSDDEQNPKTRYAFPELDTQIRACVKEYEGGVFPKLNFSSPQDASWLLPASSPLKCTSPSDVYLLLKSSDFITHDLSPERVFEGCSDVVSSSVAVASAPQFASTDASADGQAEREGEEEPEYTLELVLRKWYPIDRAREVRCFVRDDIFLGISQRDPNFYPFWLDPSTQHTVRRAIFQFWKDHIRPRWVGSPSYTFDLLLTRSLTNAHILDFNPYHPKTDPLLFDYEELRSIYIARSSRSSPSPSPSPSPVNGQIDSQSSRPGGTNDDAPPSSSDDADIPLLKVIPSASHPSAARNAPAHQHNMIPFDAVSLSSGQDIEQFADMWKASVKESMNDGDDED